MKTTELKKLMPTNKADIQGHGVVEFYTPEQVVEILLLLGVVGRSEQLCQHKYQDIRYGTSRCIICGEEEQIF